MCLSAGRWSTGRARRESREHNRAGSASDCSERELLVSTTTECSSSVPQQWQPLRRANQPPLMKITKITLLRRRSKHFIYNYPTQLETGRGAKENGCRWLIVPEQKTHELACRDLWLWECGSTPDEQLAASFQCVQYWPRTWPQYATFV